MNTISSVEFELVPRTELSPPQKEEMFGLLAQHFEGPTRDQFARDLGEKNLALLLRREGALVGFSTLLAYSIRFDGETLNIIYSGDTIVTPDAWGTSALPRAWVAGVEKLKKSLPSGRCFWLLLTSGFRTYRFLPVFWREFFPRADVPTPFFMQRLLDHVARSQFREQFDAITGIVHFNRPQRLRTELKEVPVSRVKDPHVAFFLARNPGHGQGDELACLTEFTDCNLTAAGRRVVGPRIDALLCDHR